MKTAIQKLTMIWQGISISITYNPDYSEATKKIMGYRLAHLEVETKNSVPLPITETGYRSHFSNAADVEDYGTPIEFVEAWLNETAKSKKWKKYMEQKNQLSLF